MTDIFLGIILSLLYVLMNYAFLRSILQNKAEKTGRVLMIFALFIICTLASIILYQIPAIKLMVVIVSTIIDSVFIFDVTIKKSILLNVLFFAVYASIEIIAMLILEKIIGVSGYSEITDENGAFIADLLCQFVMLLIIILLNVVTKKNTLSSMDFKGWTIFVLFPLFTLTTIIVLIQGVEKQQIGDMFSKLIVLATGLLTLNILLFLLLDNVIRRENELRNKELLIEQAEHLNQMYQSISEERERQKARSHDYLNHLQVMLTLVREGRIDDEINYIEEQIGKETYNVDVIDTGNILINAVLNIKYNEAKEKGIILPIKADNLSGLIISDSDLVTIITNILDNAIEAVLKCDDKRIVFKIIKDTDMLVIDSSNPYSGQLPDEELIRTTKPDKNNHGYGLANIRKTVASNQGNCFIDTSGGVFHIAITIPIN